MVDVVVDAPPKQQLPYDPNDIPEAVRKRVAMTDALYTNGSTPAPEVEPGPAQLTVPLIELASQTPEQQPPAPPASADSPPEDENSASWKLRYERMHGRYNASQKAIGEMQEQMVQLGNELVHAQHTTSQRPPPPSMQAPRYLTEKDVQDYGSDLVNFTQRAAVEAVAPQIMAIEQQNRELQMRLAQEARARLDMRVEAAVPEFRQIDQDPRWHRWLLGIDMLSGRVRQTLLNEAIASADAPRAISFFRGFLNEEAATGHSEPASVSHQAAPPREAMINLSSLATPGRARPATGGDFTGGLPDRPTYTRAQINQYYAAHRRGAYAGRETEWNRQEADFIAAGREGRVRN